MKQIQIGLIGAGRIGRIHAENIANIPQARVKTVCDLIPEQITAWAKDNLIEKVTSDQHDIFEDPDIDAVFICSSTDSHTALIEQAARAGKHVFCEKPISFNIAETERVVEMMERTKLQLQAGFNRRFDANFMRIRELIQEGEIGQTHLIKITSRDPAPPPYEYIKSSGGIYMDMAIHDFDMVRYLSGSEVLEVFASGACLVDPKIGELGDIDTSVITLHLSNGAIAVIDISRQAAYGYDQRVEVFGSKGNVNVQNAFPNSAELSTAEGVRKDKPLFFFLERYQASYIREVKDFITAVQLGSQAVVTGRDGLQAEKIAMAAKCSLIERRLVSLSEISV